MICAPLILSDEILVWSSRIRLQILTLWSLHLTAYLPSYRFKGEVGLQKQRPDAASTLTCSPHIHVQVVSNMVNIISNRRLNTDERVNGMSEDLPHR